ncbi:MAG: ribosome-associated translation inhibitor RaiA [Bacteroidetes bacterium]|jgi:putative sigma-54 modulation protein|nr:MAG: ribosome-associated translation inhibitor RaiA [Bacteroidota bacterium]
MKWDFQTVGFSATDELVDYTREKTEGLLKFWDQIVGAEVYLKLVQDEKNNTKVAEIKLNIPGNDIYAESQTESFEKSVNESIEKLKGQIRKIKTKMNHH